MQLSNFLILVPIAIGIILYTKIIKNEKSNTPPHTTPKR